MPLRGFKKHCPLTNASAFFVFITHFIPFDPFKLRRTRKASDPEFQKWAASYLIQLRLFLGVYSSRSFLERFRGLLQLGKGGGNSFTNPEEVGLITAMPVISENSDANSQIIFYNLNMNFY